MIVQTSGAHAANADRSHVTAPRLLTEMQAAKYMGRSQTSFRKQVALHVLPQPSTANGNRRLWDRAVLDRYIDICSGLNAGNDNSWDDL